MEVGYIENICKVVELFVDKSTGISHRHNVGSISRRLNGNPDYLPISSILLELKGHGLLESDSHVVLSERIFFITSKGYYYVTNGGIKKFYDELELKEGLELKILQQTNQSFKLNTIQFIITAVLAVGTIGSLFIQWRTFEMEKIKTELEIRDIKSRIDSIQKPIIKINKR
ncbi:MAG: hypothetical protein LBJ04_22735 [Sphingobacterium sp.]|jgi:hypothetical protein|nr:hypothetical protein [Sphingobacterium sp.]